MASRPIHQLSASLVNRIAAGEVIERPASVVKELVENAIDAGSTHIIVEIEDGGREFIRVIDNGSGIPPADLPLAFAEHATSKLTCDDDLFRISTMGFRGEALASIGAVSHAHIISRTPENDAAYEIFNRGGDISDPQAAAGNIGTTIEIRNLFYNTPARRKFMKGAPTEFGHISEMLLRLALPFPHIEFTLSHNGRSSLHLPATTPEERLLDAWPDHFREQRLPIDAADAELRLHGIVGLPELAHPTQKYQYLFLNGRYIRDKFIQHAIRESYRGLIEPGRQPAAILLIEIPPQDVDVNVHPTKIEVRFRDGGRIHSLVLSALREKLLGSDLAPHAIPRPSLSAPTPPDPQRQDMRTQLADFFRQPPSTFFTPTPPTPTDLTSPPTTPAPDSTRTGHFSDQFPSPIPTPVSPEPISQPIPQSQPQPHNYESAPPAPTLSSPAIQLHNSYLVAQSPDGLVIIDQHALHERILYEELRTRLTQGPLESQRLLIPLSLPASSRQVALLDQIQPLLQTLGIEISPFGPNSIAIHAFPSFLHRLDPITFISELLERGEQELLDLNHEEVLHEILDMMACKAAVKAGDPLTPPEIAALLARREFTDRSSNCPHGRPTTLRLSLHDLEKQFKRTGF